MKKKHPDAPSSLYRHGPLPLWIVVGCMMLIVACTGGGDGGDSTPSTAATASVTFQWDPVADSDLAGYRVYQSTSSTSLGTRIKDNIPPSTTSYQAVNLTKGTTYYFVVKAFDTSGNESSASNQISKAFP